MNYRKIRLQPIRIYEAFQLQMKRGDAISRYIVERMEEDDVMKLIGSVHIPSKTREAVAESHRYADSGRRWFEVAKVIKLWVLPCVLITFFIVLVIALLFLATMNILIGLKTMLWCGAVMALYMVFYSMGQGFFQMAARYVIQAATITANLEYTGELE